MSLENELFRQRREKLRAIEALGVDPYPHKFAASHTVPEIVARWSGATAEELEAARPPVSVAGRVMALRLHGKTGFADLVQGGSKLQIYVRRDIVGEKGFELYGLLDLGDIAAASGYLFRTKKGELSLHVDSLLLLSKALLPLPEKWHGLQDVETRYRQRYVDLIVNPEVREIFVKRSRIVAALRSALEARGYIEVETPMMQPIAGGAVARPFRTHHHALDLNLYLRIAPELYLKRLTVGGFDRVYEINRNFRNEGIDAQHNPEFTMLEFYQAYSDYRDLMDLTEQVLTAVVRGVAGSEAVPYGEHTVDFRRWSRLTLCEAVAQFWPDPNTRPTVESLGDFSGIPAAVAAYNRWASLQPEPRTALAMPEGTAPGVLLGALFELVAEHQLIQPTIVYDHPKAVSPLAKNIPGRPDWVERFEMFAGGMELANAYSELNDPVEQHRRFQQQAQARLGGDPEAHAMDEDYVRALCYGMPPAAGEGIGIDRFTMLLTNSRSIREVMLFPLLRPEGEIAIASEVAAAG